MHRFVLAVLDSSNSYVGAHDDGCVLHARARARDHDHVRCGHSVAGSTPT